MAMARLFKERGDEKTKRMRIAVPANIRWKQYETYDDVKLENKIAPIPLKIDLFADSKSAIERANLVSSRMKKSLAKTYAYYFMALVAGFFMPIFILKITGDKITKPFTMAFSNTPGILKQIHYKDSTTLGMMTSFICAGRCAISIAILSYAEKIQFSVLSDTCVEEDPKEIRKRLQEAIDELIDLGKKVDNGMTETEKSTEENVLETESTKKTQ